MLIENAVAYMKSTLFTNSMSRSIFLCNLLRGLLLFTVNITLFTNILTLERRLGYQSVGVC